LVALANLLNDYEQRFVSARDWMTLFEVYTRTQRKDGRPYIAEAAHPYTGSWEGHDTPYHSEHYFHSAYVNLLITGLVGLRPRADDSLEVNPLAPRDWSYFALDDVRYHGRRLTVIWDRDGTRYRRGRGLSILIDGRQVARAAQLRRVVAHIGAPRLSPPSVRLQNVAVNNGRGAYPWVDVSYASAAHPANYLIDGNYWYHTAPANRWTTSGTPNGRDTVTLDFGIARRIQRVVLYPLDDGPGAGVRAPARYDVELWRDGAWTPIATAARRPRVPVGRRANVVAFSPLATSRVRVLLTPQRGSALGLSEIEVWGAEQDPLAVPTEPARDLAFNAGTSGYPRASASFTAARERVEHLNDLQVAFTKYSRNRWTAAGSPNASDWVEIDMGSPREVRSVELFIFGDDGSLKAPRDYTVQTWDGTQWHDARVLSRTPAMPLASARNVVAIEPLRTARVRVVLQHDLPGFSAITELVIR
jgi:hypothetical protein